MQCPGTNTSSPDPWWGREEQTESVHVPLMIGTGVSHNSGIPAAEDISSHVSRLVAMETCPLPWLASSPEVSPILGC